MGWRETSPDIPTTIYILLTHLLILATVKTLGEWLDYTPIKMTKYKVLTFFLHAIKTSMRERELGLTLSEIKCLNSYFLILFLESTL